MGSCIQSKYPMICPWGISMERFQPDSGLTPSVPVALSAAFSAKELKQGTGMLFSGVMDNPQGCSCQLPPSPMQNPLALVTRTLEPKLYLLKGRTGISLLFLRQNRNNYLRSFEQILLSDWFFTLPCVSIEDQRPIEPGGLKDLELSWPPLPGSHCLFFVLS